MLKLWKIKTQHGLLDLPEIQTQSLFHESPNFPDSVWSTDSKKVWHTLQLCDPTSRSMSWWKPMFLTEKTEENRQLERTYGNISLGKVVQNDWICYIWYLGMSGDSIRLTPVSSSIMTPPSWRPKWHFWDKSSKQKLFLIMDGTHWWYHDSIRTPQCRHRSWPQVPDGLLSHTDTP